MKTLLLQRVVENSQATVGKLLLDGKQIAFTLEDEHRAVKIPGETRIPAGQYRIRLRTYGRFYQAYLRRFGPVFRGVPELIAVPGFTNILIHCGNTDRDTSGCILVGRTYTQTNGQYQLVDSLRAFSNLYQLIARDAAAGNLLIRIADHNQPLP